IRRGPTPLRCSVSFAQRSSGDAISQGNARATERPPSGPTGSNNKSEDETMAVEGMNHFTILTDDVDGTLDFYDELLGLTAGLRPNFDFPGAWLYAGGAPILHVIGGRPKSDLKPGVIDHMAFTGRDLSGTLAKLKARGIEHTCRRQV